jgi:hypothetical protein
MVAAGGWTWLEFFAQGFLKIAVHLARGAKAQTKKSPP